MTRTALLSHAAKAIRAMMPIPSVVRPRRPVFTISVSAGTSPSIERSTRVAPTSELNAWTTPITRIRTVARMAYGRDAWNAGRATVREPTCSVSGSTAARSFGVRQL